MQRCRPLIIIVLMILLAPLGVVTAQAFGLEVFRTRWAREDYPVQQGVAVRSWTWGPQPISDALPEPYADSPDGRRVVQYLDKSRMEVNNPNAPAGDYWFVTNGLLVVEMIEGRIQVGHTQFAEVEGGGAHLAVAGDPDTTFPTYADLARVYHAPRGHRVGDVVDTFLTPDTGLAFPVYAEDPATHIAHIERGFGIPRAFWDFMNQRGVVYVGDRFVPNTPVFDWVYVFGYPVTEAYWARVRVNGVERDVMFQAFERRVLTYTPANTDPWKVEMGNVGRQYFDWRYGE
jgi:hypothetical protein